MSPNPSIPLHVLINGFQISQAISAAVTLGIPDLLRNGAQACPALAETTRTHAPSLYRLMRALAAIGILDEQTGGRFALTPLGASLRSDVSASKNAWARLFGRPMYYQAWSGLLDSLRTGEIAFDKVHGMSVWEFRARHPDETLAFDQAMTAISDQIADAVLAVTDFSAYATVVDVGGGQGAFLGRILAQYPAMRGILFDQPHVVAHAEGPLRAAGVRDRCDLVAGSFFDAVPVGGDAYLLKWILHDWNDDDAIAILRACRRVVPPDGRLVVVEHTIGPENSGPEGKFMDLNMMVITGGVERSREEYAAILRAAGFRLTREIATPSQVSVIEGLPA